MNVIFFHPYFSDGGVERTNLGLARGLIENGNKVTFLTTSFTNHFLSEINNLGIKFVSFGTKKTSTLMYELVKYLNNISKKEKVYFVSCQYYVNVLTMIASLFVSNRKNIVFINSERNHLDEFMVKGGLKNRLMPFLVKVFYRFSDLIIANSEETAEDLSKFINKKVTCIYNPTINKRIEDLRDEEITEEWFLNDKRKFIVGIGRLSKQKDFETLIKAYSLLENKKIYKLVILGDGEDRKKLDKLVSDLSITKDVYLPGFVSNPYKFLSNSSLFVLSSRYEGLPNVLIEAVYLGITSISTKCKSGPKEILFENNLLLEVGDYKEMSRKIDILLSNTKYANNLMLKAKIGLSRFKYKTITEEFNKVIKNEN